MEKISLLRVECFNSNLKRPSCVCPSHSDAQGAVQVQLQAVHLRLPTRPGGAQGEGEGEGEETLTTRLRRGLTSHIISS